MSESISQSGTERLRPKARILRTLGDELISSEIVAVIELVKNAYDADATRVLVRFQQPFKIGEGKIEVIDNGSGMSLSTIQSTWMEPATPTKKRQHRSEQRKRRVLGEKGIGRFATSRLADFLEVITRYQGTVNEVKVLFDWNQFDDDRKYLDEIDITWSATKPQEICSSGILSKLWNDELPSSKELNHGTLLRMQRLRAVWELEQLQELRKGLSRLVSPFDKSEEFKIFLDLPEPFKFLSGIVEPPESLEHPHYCINGNLDEKGFGNLSFKLKGQDNQEPLKQQFILSNDRQPQCGAFFIELRIWDLDRIDSAYGSTIKEIRRDLADAAGINIYRDSFRVLPYGEPRNDWLRLDIRRVQNPTLRVSNNQIVGYIIISADTNPQLRDQSNREGLIECSALNDLRELVTMVLAQLEIRRYKFRRLTTDEDEPINTNNTEINELENQVVRPASVFAKLNIKAVRQLIEKRHPEDSELLAEVEKQEKELELQVEVVQETLSRYRRLAVLGQLIDSVLHNSRAPLAKIANESVLGIRDIERKNNSDSLIERLNKRFNIIKEQSNVLAAILKRIEPFGGRKRGRPSKIRLEQIIADTFYVLNEELTRDGVRVNLPQTNTEVTVEPTEIQEVIINLLQNSLYWLEQVPKDQRQIIVQILRQERDNVEIWFSDSGQGINPEFRERIFDPYFTAKPNGVGLGLTIVGEIVREYYDGDLELRGDGPLSGATFRITLRKRV